MTAKKRTQKADKSPYVYQNKKQEIGFSVDSKIPWTEKQLEFLRLIQNKECKIIFVSGPAGTSKTILAVYAGLLGLKEKQSCGKVSVTSGLLEILE
jgi:predicted ribonuclease YlaK